MKAIDVNDSGKKALHLQITKLTSIEHFVNANVKCNADIGYDRFEYFLFIQLLLNTRIFQQLLFFQRIRFRKIVHVIEIQIVEFDSIEKSNISQAYISSTHNWN